MTEDEEEHQAKVAALGCIACFLDGIENMHVSIHHVYGRKKKGAHMKVLGLCGPHHQTGGIRAPSIHPWKRRFEKKYGTQEELLEVTTMWLAGIPPKQMVWLENN